jgi:DNA-binding Lrp family transcriptional regulator
MDPLDFAIYRFLSREGEARFWAGRRVIDPRVTPREIAERVGVSESGVRRRLRHLSDRGFLRDRAVVPNPSLFDRRVYVADLLVRQSGEVDRILRDLGLVDGVVFSRDIMDEDERKMQVYFVAESDDGARRLAALLGRLAPAGTPVSARPYYIPPCTRDLSPLEWRALRFVRERPDASLAQIRQGTGMSLKTAARSYQRLIDSRACWWTHGPASEEFPLALVMADLRSAKHRDGVLGWIGATGFGWIPVASDGFGQEPTGSLDSLVGLVPADVPTALERFLRKLSGVEGVEKIRRTFALGSATYPAWFSDRVVGIAARENARR